MLLLLCFSTEINLCRYVLQRYLPVCSREIQTTFETFTKMETVNQSTILKINYSMEDSEAQSPVASRKILLLYVIQIFIALFKIIIH